MLTPIFFGLFLSSSAIFLSQSSVQIMRSSGKHQTTSKAGLMRWDRWAFREGEHFQEMVGPHNPGCLR